MLLISVIIILREVLEAAVLISIFAVLARHFILPTRSLKLGILVGVFAALLYALNLRAISSWFGGLGQEVFNALVQFAIFFSLLLVSVYFVSVKQQQSLPRRFGEVVMFTVAVLSISREGSEVFLFVSGFSAGDPQLGAVMAGIALGAGIGFSVGALTYFTLVHFPISKSFYFLLCLLGLVGAGMVIQGTKLLVQADILPSRLPLWNSNDVLNENSIPGQMLFAIFGYESTPSSIDLIAYFSAILLFVSSIVAIHLWRRGSRGVSLV